MKYLLAILALVLLASCDSADSRPDYSGLVGRWEGSYRLSTITFYHAWDIEQVDGIDVRGHAMFSSVGPDEPLDRTFAGTILDDTLFASLGNFTIKARVFEGATALTVESTLAGPSFTMRKQ